MADSTCRRNTFSLTGLQALVQSFGGSSPSEGLAGPCEVRAAKRRARAHAPLNERQAAFVRAYVLTGNTAGSYREAGYTARPNVAKVEGYWMRRRPHVKRAIAELRAARQAERDRKIERAEDKRRAELAAFAVSIARSRPSSRA